MHWSTGLSTVRKPTPRMGLAKHQGLAHTRQLFFKWIKMHLRIKRFLATSQNAVRSQIWCAVATYVLIAIVKKELKLDASLCTCLQILSVSIFEKT